MQKEKSNLKGSREKICHAALTLFTDRGIKSTTTREIAKKAGISEGTIYIYFKSKDELAYTLFSQHMHDFREKLFNSISHIDKSSAALQRLITEFYTFASNQPIKYSYIILGHHSELKKMPKSNAKPMDVFVTTIRSGIKRGEFREIDPNIAASYVIGMITRSIIFFNNGLINCSYKKLISQTIECSKMILSVK